MSQVFVVAGLGYGDEGKGSIVDFLCRDIKAYTVARYNGGAQAGHNVLNDQGEYHTFAQFGSGTFAGAGTHLSRFMMVNPIFMLSEAKHLQELGLDPWAQVTVEGTALLTTPFHVAANRLRELHRGWDTGRRHGSCGMGIGETMQDYLVKPSLSMRVGDLTAALYGKPAPLREKLVALQKRKLAEMEDLLRDAFSGIMAGPEGDDFHVEMEILEDPKIVDRCVEQYVDWAEQVLIVGPDYLTGLLKEGHNIVFEGAQGFLLDEQYGFHPYTTWSNTTFGNALTLLEGAVDFKDVRLMGVLRTFATRHGVGPFPTEDLDLELPDPRNGYGDWQQGFRVGHFDLVLARYAKAIMDFKELAITWSDKRSPFKICVAYQDSFGYQQTVLPTPSSLKQQEELTQDLHRWKPVYKTFKRFVDFVRFVETELQVSVTLVSGGPGAKNKVWQIQS